MRTDLLVPARSPAWSGGQRSPARWDWAVFAATLAFVLVAFRVGALLNAQRVPLHADTAPLFAEWGPRVGPGTVFAAGLAVLGVIWGPSVAARLRWPTLLAGAYGFSVAWTFALAMVDGWWGGIAGRLVNPNEYVYEVPRVHDIAATVRGFAGHILDFQRGSWTTHTAGHPPGALLVFVWANRLGLSTGGAAGVLCILVGAAATVAVTVTVRTVASETAARSCVPFLVLFPGAVWIGVSADGLFTGVTAVGVACLAVGAQAMTAAASLAKATLLCVLGGLLLGLSLYLSYGLLLFGSVALVATLLASAGKRWWLPLFPATGGVFAVVAAFSFAGFWWFDGYQLTVRRYYQGIGNERPYGYWVWADIASFALSAGPILFVLLRRCVATRGRGVAALALAAALAVALADLSGLSKAEVERIWLPFGVWVLAATPLLPARGHRCWLAAQAVTALLINHLLVTYW